MMKYIPDKYLAIGSWTVLLSLYLWTKDDTVRYMMLSMFGVVIIAFKDGLNRVYESFKNRIKTEDKYGNQKKDNES